MDKVTSSITGLTHLLLNPRCSVFMAIVLLFYCSIVDYCPATYGMLPDGHRECRKSNIRNRISMDQHHYSTGHSRVKTSVRTISRPPEDQKTTRPEDHKTRFRIVFLPRSSSYLIYYIYLYSRIINKYCCEELNTWTCYNSFVKYSIRITASLHIKKVQITVFFNYCE